uniref:tetratricopeptide repeat protein n=1 Tax=Sphingomonas sp. TaxID=28214 RepID=UPI00286A841B
IADSIPYFEKAAALMDSDWHNPSMLITCYQGIGAPDQLLRVARMASERTEKAIAKDPSNTAVLAAGASALAIVGEDQRARDWIERALLLDPDNIIMRYNHACALTSQLDDPDRAIEVLEPYFATTVSATHIRHAEVDPDLDLLREDPRFKKMLAAAKQRLGLAA